MNSQATTRTSSRSLPPRFSERTLRVLMADDDRNEQLLAVLAAEEASVAIDFTFVDDGTHLLIELNRLLELGDLPDLVILDLRMPILDGHRTLTQLQAHPLLWQVPVIVFSSSTRRKDYERSFRHGARWFETKPGNFPGMLDFVNSLPDRAVNSQYSIPPTNPAEPVFDDYYEEIDLTEFEA